MGVICSICCYWESDDANIMFLAKHETIVSLVNMVRVTMSRKVISRYGRLRWTASSEYQAVVCLAGKHRMMSSTPIMCGWVTQAAELRARTPIGYHLVAVQFEPRDCHSFM